MIVRLIRKVFFRVTQVPITEVEAIITEQNAKRAALEARLDKVAEATLNGDSAWFTLQTEARRKD